MASKRKRGNGYQITVSNGRRPDGTQIIETTTWYPDPDKTDKQNEKDLQRFMLNFEEKVKAGKTLKGDKIKVSDFAEMWLNDSVKKTKELNTCVQYEHHLNTHILPEIGNLRLSEVNTKHLIDLFNKMNIKRKDGREGGYSTRTIKYCKAICSAMFSTAIEWRMLKENPCDTATVPKTAKEETNAAENVFTQEQTILFLEFLNRDFAAHHKEHDRFINGKQYHVAEYTETHSVPTQLRIFYNLAIFGGFRRGELVGLKWEDVDFDHNTLSIRRSTVQIEGKAITKTPKNKTSRRQVALPPEIMQMFKEYKKEQLEYRLACGTFWTGDGTNVFIQRNGEQIFPDTPTKAFKRIIKRYNKEYPDNPLPEITLHGLRHTSASLSVYAGTDVKTISKRLGHAQTSTTLNVYAYAFEKADQEAATALEKMLKHS